MYDMLVHLHRGLTAVRCGRSIKKLAAFNYDSTLRDKPNG
jgi:hypothetical protein